VNRSRHQFLGRLATLLQIGRRTLGNFRQQRRRRPLRGRHVLDVIVKSSRQQKMERARRWRRGLQWSVLSAAVILAAVSSRQAVARYFWQNPDLRLAHRTTISTNGNLTHDEILRHARLDEQTHVYDVDLQAVRERLEALPHVRHASVTRELPGRLVITVEERRPAMWLSCDSPKLRTLTADPAVGACLLDKDGHLFHCTELRTELLRLPVLHLRKLNHLHPGTRLTLAPVQTGLNLLQRLHTTFGPRGLDVAEIDAPNDWSLVAKFSDDLTVTFGYDDLDAQVDRLVRIVDIASASGRPLRTVNLLPSKNVPVTFADAPSGPAPVGARPPGTATSNPPAATSPRPPSPESDSLEAILGGGR